MSKITFKNIWEMINRYKPIEPIVWRARWSVGGEKSMKFDKKQVLLELENFHSQINRIDDNSIHQEQLLYMNGQPVKDVVIAICNHLGIEPESTHGVVMKDVEDE